MPNGLFPDGAHVLIVDDVASEAMTIELLCRSLGVATVHATGAAEASEILSRVRPAAIITDLVMPGADGLDFLFMIADYAPTFASSSFVITF